MRRRTEGNGIGDSPHMEEALRVAYYHCVLEMPLKAIAEMFGKSPATITRRLDEVRQAGWLRDRPEFNPPPDVWRDVRARITCSDMEATLQDHFGKELLPRITVLPSAPGGTPTEVNPVNVERIGLYAASRLAEELLDKEHVVGINWGWSVRHCVTNLHPSRPNPELRFIPLVGSLSLDENDPHFEEAIECSSNRLSQLAAASFGGPRAPRLTTPAYIPRRFHADARGLKSIRDFIESDVSFARIFGNKKEPGLIEQVDTVVTGLSSIDVETLPIYRPNLITQEDLPVLESAGVVGDLALHLIVEKESTKAEVVNDINDLIVGASPQDFINVAERARKGESQGLGVMVLAAGAWKARILATAIRLGAVTELITDMDTATAIDRHVRS